MFEFFFGLRESFRKSLLIKKDKEEDRSLFGSGHNAVTVSSMKNYGLIRSPLQYPIL